jgi:prevent-host-death family protein
MKQFRFSDLNRVSGEVLDAAMRGPVSLTKRGKEKLVILSAEDYHRLIGRARAHTVEGAPDDIHEDLMTGLDMLLDDGKDV